MSIEATIVEPMKSAFPNPEGLLELPIEEAAGLLLEVLISGKDNLKRYGHPSLPVIISVMQNGYGAQISKELERKIATAWQWLLSEAMICPTPDQNGINGCIFVTELGEQNANRDLAAQYTKSQLLSREHLHPAIQDTVLPLYIRSQYDTAIFEAYKAVEVATRGAAGYGNDRYGTDMMRQAFHADTGPIRNEELEKNERESMAHLYAGAIGLYKNPQSHRTVGIDDPLEAAEVIMFASHLLRVIDRQS